MQTLMQYVALIEKADPSICICVTDTELEKPGPTIQYVNKRWETVTGYKHDEVVGKVSPRILQGAASNREMLTRLKETLKRGESFEGNTINYRKDGTPIHMAWVTIAKIVNSHKYYVALQRMIQGEDPLEQLNIIKQVEESILSKLDKLLPQDYVRKTLEPTSDGD